MGEGIQLNQIIDDLPRNNIRSLGGDELDVEMLLIDDKFGTPLAVGVTGDILYIGPATIDTYESDGADGVSGSYKWRLPPLSGQDLDPGLSTIDLTDGSTTGDFANNPATGLSMTASNYVQIGIELRDDGKYYVVWGNQDAVEANTEMPTFDDAAIPIVVGKLRDDSLGGEWNFNTPARSDFEIVRGGAGSGGGGGDSSFKVASMDGTNVLIKRGYYRWDDGTVLATGNVSGVDDVEDITIDLASIVGAPDNSSVYWFYIDFTQLSAEVTLTDNGREVYRVYDSSHFVLRKDEPFMNPARYVFLGGFKTPAAGNTFDGAEFWTGATRLHSQLGGFLPVTEEFEDETITAVSGSVSLAHGLTEKPQLVQIEFHDDSASQDAPLNPANHVLDVNDTHVVVSSTGLTFDASDFMRVRAFMFPRLPNTVLDVTRVFRSEWHENSGTTQEAHQLADKFEIVNLVVLEWDVSNDRIKKLPFNNLVKYWDDDNVYYDWTGLSPTSTMKYRVISAPTAQPYAKPFKGNMFEFTDGATLTDVTTAFPCNKMYYDYPFTIRAVQKMTNGWQNVDTIGGLVWVTTDSNHYLRGDISSLSPSGANPVKITIE